MAREYILAHDLGTSGNKATLYDLRGVLKSSAFYAYDTYYPETNWVEQDPEDWWKAVRVSTKQPLQKAGVSPNEVLCVSFSGQMMGCLPVDKAGVPLRRSIIWADSRGISEAGMMEDTVGMKTVYHITGHRISASYSAAKILWVKNNEPEIFARTYKFLQAKDYVVHKLTGKFFTDYSDASGTNLFDLQKKEWSDEILTGVKLDANVLPEAVPSTAVVGEVTQSAAAEVGLLAGTPVVIGGGDGCCAATGAGVVDEGSAYNALGSSSWIAMAAKKPIFDSRMQTFNWVHLDENLYSPCGTMQAAGYSYRWLKDTLCGLEVKEAEEKNVSPYQIIDQLIESSEPGASDLLFLPYLLGERSPRWNPDARGAFVGLKITTKKADIYRAVLEGVTFNLKVILDVFDRILPIDELIVIGGGAKSRVWVQILANIWQKPILIPEFLEEATSMGAAVCGGVGIGAFSDFSAAHQFSRIKKRIEPDERYAEKYARLYELFNQAYEALVPVYSELATVEKM